MYVILFGAPGVGKGTQAAILAEKTGLVHITTGELFREAIRQETELGKQAKVYYDRGQLVPDHLTIAMLLERLSKGDCAGGCILDGFPRTLEQATALSPKGVDYHVSLADEYVRLGRTEDAEGVFTKLLNAYEIKGIESSKLRRAYARFLGSQGRLEEAERFFKESVEFGESFPDALREAHLAYVSSLLVWR